MASINGTDNLFLSISLQIAVVGGYIEEAKHHKNKNGHILPTGQWYAPSAVIKHAWC